MQYFICYLVLMISIANDSNSLELSEINRPYRKTCRTFTQRGREFMVGCLYVAVVYGGLIIIGVLFQQRYLQD